MDIKFGQIILKPEQPQTQIEVFMADKEFADDSNLGVFFAIVEIFSREKKAKKAVIKIVELTKNDYYNSPTSDPETALEEVCQNLNRTLPEIIENPKNWLPKINIFLGAVKDEKICMSSFGKIKSFLIRDNKMSPIISEKEKQEKSKKIMSHLIVGEIAPEDTLIFSNNSLFDYFSKEKIKKTITALNPEQSAEYFKNFLTENLNSVSFGTIILKIKNNFLEEKIATKNKVPEFYGTKESLANFTNMERKTTKILSASMAPNIKNFLSKFSKKPSLKLDKNMFLKKINVSKLSIGEKKGDAFKPIISLARNIKIYFLSAYLKIVFFFKNFKKMRLLSKIAAFGLFILIIIFSISLIFSGSYKNAKTAEKNFQEQKTNLENIISKAEANLIYNDEDGASENLKQAKIIFANLPTEKKSWQKDAEIMEQNIKNLEDKIYHISDAKISTIADFQNIENEKIINIAKNKNNIFALSQSNLYEINPSEKSYEPIENDNKNLTAMRAWDENNIIFTDNSGTIKTYNVLQKTFSEKKLIINSSVIDWNIYADKIYEIKQDGIIKISSPLSENPISSKWYNDDISYIKDSSEIIIDGDIWLGGKNIIRLYKGKKTNFEISEIDKNLGDDLEIYTENAWNNIYILDKKNNRIIVASKSGSVEKQFRSDKFYSAKNLIISSDQKTAYLIDGLKIIGVELE
jgi:hypothetical protein